MSAPPGSMGVFITAFPGIGYTVYTQCMDPLGLASGAKSSGGERWELLADNLGKRGGMERGGRAVEGGNGRSAKGRNGGEE